MLSRYKPTNDNADAMWRLARTLQPIYRTLVSPGFEESLGVIDKELGLNVKKYPSGQEVFSWIIPDAWTVREGYLETEHGERLMDLKDEPLFVGPYSISFSGVVSREELMEHVYTLPHLPKAVPLSPSYYKKDWKLAIPHELKERLTDERYRVHIDSAFKPGNLCIGEVYLPGMVRDEIIFSTYMCHPMTANDNLSGVVVTVELFKILSQMGNRYYSYRLIIIPETIGSITFLYHHRKEVKNMVGGYNITCVGDRGGITLKKSWAGDTVLDRAAMKVLAERGVPHCVKDYYLSGSDERQFNAPGFRIAMPTIMRTPPAEYPEYHSSFDNFECIGPSYLNDTLDFLLATLFILDNNKTYTNKYSGVPFLTRYDLHKQVRTGQYGLFNKAESGIDEAEINQIVIHETDGRQDLLTISEKWKCPFSALKQSSEVFAEVGLVEEVKRPLSPAQLSV